MLCLSANVVTFADETVTLTTFYPQQMDQTTALGGAPLACSGVGWTALVTINTFQQARLLILWTLDAGTAAAGGQTVTGRVTVGGVQTGSVASAVLTNVTSPHTLAGQAVNVGVVPPNTAVTLECTSTGGLVSANPVNTTLTVVELR